MQEANVGDNTVLTQNYHLWSAWAGLQQLDVSGRRPIVMCSSNIILQLGGEEKHSDWLGAVHYLRQKSTVMELGLT